MLIPTDRPIIDATNIAAAATQTVSDGFAATHNNKSVLLLSCDSADRTSSGTTPIQAGVKAGQLLTIIVTDEANGVIIQSAGNTVLNGNWSVADGYGTGAWLKVVWDGSVWREIGRGNGEINASGKVARAEGTGTAATGTGSHAEGIGSAAYGLAAHAEGNSSIASDTGSHAEGSGTASGVYSHAEGNATQASGIHAHAEGNTCVASGNYGAHAEGSGSVASGDRAHAEGTNTTASGIHSHAEGVQSVAALRAEHAHSSGKFVSDGDAQNSKVQLKAATTNATLTEMFLDGSSLRLMILDEYTYGCKVMVVGRQDNGTDHFMGTYHVLIQRTGGTVALVSAIDVIYENNAGGLGAGGGLPVQITADNTNKALAIKVEGLTGHNIRWVAVVDMIRVGYAD